MSSSAPTLFLTNTVHHPVEERLKLKVVQPKPIRPFSLEKNHAVNYLDQFLSELDTAIATIVQRNKFFGHGLPQKSVKLCKYALLGKVCPFGIYCTRAGSLVDLYAKNILIKPYYKTFPCKFGSNCNYGPNCLYGHPGDIMRIVCKIGDRIFTTGIYVLPSMLNSRNPRPLKRPIE